MSDDTTRTIKVEALARVEGEGAMHVEIRDGALVGVELQIYEPPRFFEAFLRGRRHTEPPDITARICGICPVAYQMSACEAIEDACGVVVDGPLRALRRLLYCGEWIESHTLHVYMLHAPDFLGYHGAIEMAADHRERVEQGLALKKVGNQIVEVLGGRAIHPLNVRVGGFYRVPTRRELQPVLDGLLRVREIAEGTVRWVGAFDMPDLTYDHELVALSRPDEYAVVGGNVVSSSGLDIPVSAFLDEFAEEHVARSNALHAYRSDGTRYLVGPMARFALGYDRLSESARAAAVEVGVGPDDRNPFRSIVVRAVEVLHAVDEAIGLIEAYEPPDQPAVPVEPRAGVGHGVSEAPRGLLYHRYTLDDEGFITDAVIVPPTSQNQPSIEADLFRLVEQNLDLDDDALRHVCEQSIRNHDPCISCATHFLDLTVDRG
ncbi:MAG: nickel-dependent hydrogenase large subunit [Acidimicrobiales bacterium]|nr:nickel-dependent hydrogenase large subunit [Acidimicrobiales bacterium]